MGAKLKTLVEGAKKIWPTDKRLAKDLARRTKDIGKKFPNKKALLAEAKKQGIKNAANVHKRKNGRNQLIELVAKKQKGSARLRDTPVTLGGTARTALDVGLTVPRAVTALGSFQAPAGAGPVRRFMRGGALVHGALQAGKGGYLALGKGEKADAARREALREYGADAEFMGQKAADLKIGSTQNLLRAAEAGFLNPAESTYASVQAAKLMAQQSKDWEQEGLAKYNPFTYKIGTYTGGPTGKTTPQLRAERIAAGETINFSGGLRRDIGLARKNKYVGASKEDRSQAQGLVASLKGGDERLFYGLANDPEFQETDLSAIPDTDFYKDKYGDYRDQQALAQEEMASSSRKNTGTKENPNIVATPKQFFTEADRAAFMKAAQGGELLEMFDTNKDKKLSREEQKDIFVSGDKGFISRAKKKGLYGEDMIPAPEPDYPTEPAAIEGDLPVHAAGSDFDRPEYGGTVGELEEPTEAPEPPPTTGDYADMMRQAIDNEAIDIEERNEVMRTIRESMVEQGLTTPEQFNQIGRQMLEDSDARKAAAHVAYLRSSAGSDWVDTPGLDRLAALQKAPFGRGTALEGSVGKLTDESRQLESRGGRQRRLARELEGKGYGSVAGQVRAGAPRRPLMSQRDRIELEKKKKALAAEQAAAQALISEGEKKIETPTVS